MINIEGQGEEVRRDLAPYRASPNPLARRQIDKILAAELDPTLAERLREGLYYHGGKFVAISTFGALGMAAFQAGSDIRWVHNTWSQLAANLVEVADPAIKAGFVGFMSSFCVGGLVEMFGDDVAGWERSIRRRINKLF